jgi:peptidoglycan/LPS O-acetylase OafA/YrhL
VLLSHISLPQISGQLKAFSNTGSQAVNVFFVLSGFVIAHVWATREGTFREYAIARAVRIYSVAIPALILTLLLDNLGMFLNPNVYSEGYQNISPFLLFRSIFYLGEQWGTHRYPGSNSAYWSLGFEVWYYVAFAAFVFSGWLASIAVLVFIGPKVAAMFPLWLMGVAVYRICGKRKLPKTIGWLWFIAPVCLMALYETLPHSYVQPFYALTSERLASLVQDYFIGLMFSVHLIGFATLSDAFAPFLETYSKQIRWIAGSTFSVYLAHLPIMHFLAALGRGVLPVASLVALTLLFCLVFAQFTERKKHVWKGFLERLWGIAIS